MGSLLLNANIASVTAYPYFDDSSEKNFELLVKDIQERGGCALIGAGLSQQAGMPGWEGIIKKLRAAAGLPPKPFNPHSAEREMETLRESLDDRFLAALREAFDLTGRELPESYQRLSNIRFDRLATINIDDLLHHVVTILRRDEESTIYVYGTDEFLGKSYYYLHGRLKTARSPGDLVLCSDDYAVAYGPEGEAWRVLGALARAPGPLLFIGSSMADVDVRYVLRYVNHCRVSRRGESERRVSEPPWFAILPANLYSLIPVLAGHPLTEEQKNELTGKAVAAKTDELGLIRVIWYEYDRAHRGLELLIRRLEHLCARPIDAKGDPFLASARELDDLALLTQPSETQIQRVVDLIRVRGNRTHFLRQAVDSWLPLLWDCSELRSFQEPQLGDDGNYYIKAWDAAGFVTRSAGKQPETTLRMIMEIKTENWGVVTELARAATELPSDLLKSALPAFAEWLHGRFASTSLAGHFLLELIDRLVDEDEDETALQLFALLGEWEEGTDGNG